MDGTLVALFFVKNYSAILASNDTTPYTIARPLFDTDIMESVVNGLKAKGYRIGIISYYGADSNIDMIKATRKAKREWLKKYFPYANEIHIIKPTTKKNTIAKKGDILVDDSKKNREQWTKGKAINGYFRNN